MNKQATPYFPVANIVEMMRPLPIDPVAGMPAFVCGLSLIRGVPVPVVELRVLLEGKVGWSGRFVVLRIDGRQVAVLVEAVLGVRALPTSLLRNMPPLLQDACPDMVTAITALDQQLVTVLSGTRIVPEELWRALEAGQTVTFNKDRPPAPHPSPPASGEVEFGALVG